MKNKYSIETMIGMVLILLGVIFLIKITFNLNFNLLRIIAAGVLIYLGLVLIRSRMPLHDDNLKRASITFGEGELFIIPEVKTFSVLFGQGSIDLTKPGAFPEGVLEFSVVFGELRVKIPGDMDIKINSNTVFGATTFPDWSSSSFGRSGYIFGKAESQGKTVLVDCHTVFGNTKFFIEG